MVIFAKKEQKMIDSAGAKVAKGTFWLALGSGVGTLISALAIVIIARFLGPNNYGVYSAALIVSFIFAASDLGINNATTHYISKNLARNKDFRLYIKAALLSSLFSGLFFFLIINLSAGYIASVIFQKNYLTPLITIASFMVFAAALNNVIRGILLGLERTDFIAFLLIVSSIFRNLFAIMLILLGLGALGAITGQTIGVLLIMILGLLIVYRQTRYCSSFSDNASFIEIIKEMYSYSLPIAGLVFANAIFQQFYNIIAARSLSDFIYGNFSAAWVVYGASMIFVYSLASALFPSLSKLAALDENIVPRNYSTAVKYASLVLLPTTIIFVGVPEELIISFYGPDYALAAGFLRLLSITLFLCVVGVGVTGPALLSLKRTKTLATVQIVAIIISYLFITFLLGASSAYVFIIGVIVMNLVSAILGFLVLWHDYGASIDFVFSLKALFSALVALGVIYLIKGCIPHPFLAIVICGFIAVATYAALIAILGALNESDYRNLRNYARAIPIISKLLLLIIAYMEKIYKRTRSSR